MAGRQRPDTSSATAALHPGAAKQLSAAALTVSRTQAAAVVSVGQSWNALGPATVTSTLYGPVTGRVTSVSIDPNDPSGNTVWLGTTGGGVWKSTNAAGTAASASFAPLTDDLPAFSQNAGTAAMPSLSIGAIAVQPSANPVVLAGTGDPNDATDSYYGEGILRSADGGQTWTVIQIAQNGTNGNHSLVGLATSAIAWSTATPTLAVAAMSVSAEGTTVGANTSDAVPGMYFSTDAGVTWQMANVSDGSQPIERPSTPEAFPGASATSVVWDAQRQVFFAALQFHGYYASSDGQTWTRLANQPGTGLTMTNCPTNSGTVGSVSCPILRGTLAVQPATGDLYALTVDANDNDQGLWQDLCNVNSAGQCSNPAPAFSTRIDKGALETGQGTANGSTQIAQGSYNLALAAVPDTSGNTLLFAGTIDLYRCSLAPGSSACTFRNTTNAGNGCNANAGVAPAEHALAGLALPSGGPVLFVANDGGLWRSMDGVAETGSACSAPDASHFQNLNAAIGMGGSLAEIVGFAQDPVQNTTLIAGMGALGSAASTAGTGAAAWPQLSEGEGGFPLIDPVTSTNWYLSIGAGVNVRLCPRGTACTAADFAGSADIGAIQTGYDTALIDAPLLLDPQQPASLLAGTCRVWRGPANNGAGWNSTDALSPALDNGGTPCLPTNALVRSLSAGGPTALSGAEANLGSTVLYAGMAGSTDGGGTLPGHVFVTKRADTADANTAWLDITGSPVANNSASFNSGSFDISSVVADSHDATGATVYATVMGFSKGDHVYRSTDFGAHWTSLDANLPAVPVNALVVDPNDANTVYVATDTGVYATQQVATCVTQNCWSLLGSGLPNAPVTSLQAGAQLPTTDGRVGMLRAGTYGRGLWELPLLTAHSTQQPELSASPGSLSFLAQPVGTQSNALTVTLLSFGNAPATVTSVAITSDFAETDTCTGQSIAVGGNCTVSVRFTPTATGSRTGLLTVYGNVPGGQITVALSGTATASAAVLLTPLQLTFSPTLVNQSTAAQIITVSNTGGNPATLQTPTVTGDFAITANTCGSSLPSQTGCSIAITFTPTASGSRTGVLTVVDSAGTQTAQLSGTGQSPATDTLSTGALIFAQQQVGTTSAAQQVMLTNAGDVPLTLVTAVVTAGDFAATNSCGTSLAAHSSCAVNVVFVPTATGTRTGQLQITDQFRSQTVSLSGAGLAPPGVSLSPSTLSFGSIGVGLSSSNSSLVLTNNGGVPLLLGATTVSGDFQIASTTCSTSLLPGSACTMNVFFAPTAAGTRSGSLVVADNAGTGKQTVSLTGTGIDFALAANGPISETVASGSIATFPLQLTSVIGLSGTVSFTCAGAPANTACTVNPSPAQLGGAVPVSVTLQTGIIVSGNRQPGPPSRELHPVLLCFLAVPAGYLGGRRRRHIFRRLAVILCCTGLLAGLTLGLSGCGATRLIPLTGTGSTGGSGTGTGSSQPTSPGTYPITVTGASDGVTHAVSLTLVVQ